MRAFTLIFLVSITLVKCVSCGDDPSPLDGVNTEWLDATIEEINKSSIKNQTYIVRADYEGTCVVYVNNCCPNCLTAIILYRCDDGTKIDNADLSKLKDDTTIWTPEDFSCQMM